MYIRTQKVVRNDNGTITSGCAALCKTEYDPTVTSGHSRRKVVERLGKVVWLNENNTEGVFVSPMRGLVRYNLTEDSFYPVSLDDFRLKGTPFEEKGEVIHTIFGDVYLLLSVLGEGCLLKVFRNMYPETAKYERLLAHLTHSILKNGSREKCGEFLAKSMVTYLFQETARSTLDCDSAFFYEMGTDEAKVSFFKGFVTEMRKTHPSFGRACYVDSTPMPNESKGNPYNALCSHGTDGLVMQTRLALVLDVETNLPVWFHVFPGNVLDHSTIMDIAKDVKASIDVDIIDAVLDAGYACKELFEKYHVSEESAPEEDDGAGSILVRMPAKNGYPHDELYLECKNSFHDVDYLFDYKGHTYFAKAFNRACLGFMQYCYVFVDHDQASDLGRHWRIEHPDDWELLSKNDKEWCMVKDGFFILIGNKWNSPRNVLIEYRDRVKIELIFKTMKDFTDLLPIAKWKEQRVLGKILFDVIGLIAERFFNNALSVLRMEIPKVLTQLQSLSCFKGENGLLVVYTPKANVREMYEKVGYSVPAHFDVEAFRKEVIQGIPMERVPVTTARKRPGRKPKAKNPSPEEKVNGRNLKAEIKLAETIRDKAIKDADKAYARETTRIKADYDKAICKAEKKRDTIANSSTRNEEEKNHAEEVFVKAKEEALQKYNALIVKAMEECEVKKTAANTEYETHVSMANEQYAYGVV